MYKDIMSGNNEIRKNEVNKIMAENPHAVQMIIEYENSKEEERKRRREEEERKNKELEKIKILEKKNYLKNNKYDIKGSVVVETIKGENMEDMNNKLQDYLIELQAKNINFDIINISQNDSITASKSIERNSLIFGEFLEYGGTIHYHQYITTIIIKIK
jgi:aspartokinase